MSEFKGTKKNWLLNDTENNIYGGSDNYNMITAGNGCYNFNGDIQSGFCLTGYISKENANLIVISPDLLECLKGLSDAISTGSSEKLSKYNLKSKELIKQLNHE